MNPKNIGELAQMWKKDKKPFLKESSYSVYHSHLEQHILPLLSHETDITEEEAQTLVLVLSEEGLAPKTVRDIMLVLKMILRWGAKYSYCSYPDWKLRFPPQKGATSDKILTGEEHRRLAKYVREHLTNKNLGLYLCLGTGLRIGEICALQWKDIDLRENVVRVSKTVQRIYYPEREDNHTQVHIGTPKTSSSFREIPIPNKMKKILGGLVRLMNPEYYVVENSPKPTEPRSYRRYFTKLMEEQGFPPIHFHGLRHSFATRCIEAGCDYKTVSVLLGHSNINTTLNLYVHPGMQQKQKCMERVWKELG